MTYRDTIQDISVTLRHKGDDWVSLEIRHKNNLILDNVTILIFGYVVSILHTKPYTLDIALGLVVEWIVNNLKSVDSIVLERPSRFVR